MAFSRSRRPYPQAPARPAAPTLTEFWTAGPAGFSGRSAYLLEAIEDAILQEPQRRWPMLAPFRDAYVLHKDILAAYSTVREQALAPSAEHALQTRLDQVAQAMLNALAGRRN